MSTITTDHRSVRSGEFDPHTITAATFEPRIIPDPAALGLGASALTTFALSLANSGIVGEQERRCSQSPCFAAESRSSAPACGNL